jgi:hypothetical protein
LRDAIRLAREAGAGREGRREGREEEEEEVERHVLILEEGLLSSSQVFTVRLGEGRKEEGREGRRAGG